MSQKPTDLVDAAATPTPPSNLVLIGTNNYGGKHYSTSGTIQFGGWHGANLEVGDSITDAGGKGMTVYVHACDECGTLLLRTLIALVPVFCEDCQSKIQRLYSSLDE